MTRIVKAIKRYRASRKLSLIVEQRRNSFEIMSFRKNRAAQLKSRKRQAA